MPACANWAPCSASCNRIRGFLKGHEPDEEVAEIERLIAERNQARADKNWAAADAARNRLTEMGIVLEDSAGKTSWRRA